MILLLMHVLVNVFETACYLCTQNSTQLEENMKWKLMHIAIQIDE